MKGRDIRTLHYYPSSPGGSMGSRQPPAGQETADMNPDISYANPQLLGVTLTLLRTFSNLHSAHFSGHAKQGMQNTSWEGTTSVPFLVAALIFLNNFLGASFACLGRGERKHFFPS